MTSLRDTVPAPAWTRVVQAARGLDGAQALADSYQAEMGRLSRIRGDGPAAATQASTAALVKLKQARQAVKDARELLREEEIAALLHAARTVARQYADAALPLASLRDLLLALDHLVRTRGGLPLLHPRFRDEYLSAPVPPSDDDPPRLLAPGVSEAAKLLASTWDKAIAAAAQGQDADVTQG